MRRQNRPEALPNAVAETRLGAIRKPRLGLLFRDLGLAERRLQSASLTVWSGYPRPPRAFGNTLALEDPAPGVFIDASAATQANFVRWGPKCRNQ